VPVLLNFARRSSMVRSPGAPFRRSASIAATPSARRRDSSATTCLPMRVAAQLQRPRPRAAARRNTSSARHRPLTVAPARPCS
jgi:hypothetical protein